MWINTNGRVLFNTLNSSLGSKNNKINWGTEPLAWASMIKLRGLCITETVHLKAKLICFCIYIKNVYAFNEVATS